MDSANIFKTIKPIYKEIKASKRTTKRRLAKSLSRYLPKSQATDSVAKIPTIKKL